MEELWDSVLCRSLVPGVVVDVEQLPGAVPEQERARVPLDAADELRAMAFVHLAKRVVRLDLRLRV